MLHNNGMTARLPAAHEHELHLSDRDPKTIERYIEMARKYYLWLKGHLLASRVPEFKPQHPAQDAGKV